jgi:hypothetical protein
VVTEAVFPKINFVDRDSQLVFSNEKNSVCQFVITRCNLHTNISPNEWWKHTQKYLNQTINRLRNDRNTAMKWTTLGKLFHAGYGSNKLTKMKKKLTVRSLCNKRLVPTFRQNHKDWKAEGHETRISLEAFLEGRKNQEDYTVLFEQFVPCVTKKTVWDICLCRVSNEAFVLLLLENSFERWLDLFSNHKGPGMQQRGV